MQHIQIICVGKLKENYLTDAVLEYSKRLSPYCRLTIKELPAEKLSLNPSLSEISAALKREADAILSSIAPLAYTFALCIEGKQVSSEVFSEKLSSLSLTGKSSVTFIIGSSYGLDITVKKRADFLLSLSKMTFPHQLFRVMLLEQLYRAYQINKGGKYHK